MPSVAISDVRTRRITNMNALGAMPLVKREASSEVSPVHQRKTYRAEINQTTAVKPMSMLVHGYERISICELLLWKFWNGV